MILSIMIYAEIVVTYSSLPLTLRLVYLAKTGLLDQECLYLIIDTRSLAKKILVLDHRYSYPAIRARLKLLSQGGT